MAITRKNLQALLHDKRTVGLLIMMPIIMMVLFDEGGEGIPYMGINDTKFSEIFIRSLEEDDRVDVELLNLNTFNLSEEIPQIY